MKNEIRKYLAKIGGRGGSSRSAKKIEASRKNGAMGGPKNKRRIRSNQGTQPEILREQESSGSLGSVKKEFEI